jgi:hypothetical protein
MNPCPSPDGRRGRAVPVLQSGHRCAAGVPGLRHIGALGPAPAGRRFDDDERSARGQPSGQRQRRKEAPPNVL